MPQICHCLKYQLSILTKQSILRYLSTVYPNVREKFSSTLIAVNYLYDNPHISPNHSYEYCVVQWNFSSIVKI